MTADGVTVMDKKTKELRKIPYGVCVWSTGVAATPLTNKLMTRIPEQGKGCVHNCGCLYVCMYVCGRACMCVGVHACVIKPLH